MKQLSFIVFIAVISLVACQKNHHTPFTLQLNQQHKQLLFFSDEDNIQNENAYYDALLEIKKDYPTAVSNMMVISSTDNRDLGKFEVDTYPTLMVVYKNKIITKVDGNINSEEIIGPIVQALKSK